MSPATLNRQVAIVGCGNTDYSMMFGTKDPLRTQCVLPEQLSEIDCTPQQQDETDEHYRQRLVTALQALVILVLLYLRDCICYSILPPCPDEPAAIEERRRLCGRGGVFDAPVSVLPGRRRLRPGHPLEGKSSSAYFSFTS